MRPDELATDVLDRLTGGPRIAVVVGGELARASAQAGLLRRLHLGWRPVPGRGGAPLMPTDTTETAGAW